MSVSCVGAFSCCFALGTCIGRFKKPGGAWRGAEEWQSCFLELRCFPPTTTAGLSILSTLPPPAVFPESSSRSALWSCGPACRSAINWPGEDSHRMSQLHKQKNTPSQLHFLHVVLPWWDFERKLSWGTVLSSPSFSATQCWWLSGRGCRNIRHVRSSRSCCCDFLRLAPRAWWCLATTPPAAHSAEEQQMHHKQHIVTCLVNSLMICFLWFNGFFYCSTDLLT